MPKSKKKSVGSKKSEGEKMSMGASSCARMGSLLPSAYEAVNQGWHHSKTTPIVLEE
jgi:hypothetical protein